MLKPKDMRAGQLLTVPLYPKMRYVLYPYILRHKSGYAHNAIMWGQGKKPDYHEACIGGWLGQGNAGHNECVLIGWSDAPWC